MASALLLLRQADEAAGFFEGACQAAQGQGGRYPVIRSFPHEPYRRGRLDGSSLAPL